MRSISYTGKLPVSDKAGFHGPRGTSFDTEFTGAALGGIKDHLHVLAVDVQGTGGTNGRASSAVDAFVIVPGDVLVDGFGPYTHLREVFHPSLEIRLRTAQFQNHKTLLPGQDAGLEDVEAEVEVLHQPVNDGFVPVLFGKMEYDLLEIIVPPLLHLFKIIILN